VEPKFKLMDEQPLQECIGQEWGRVALVTVCRIRELQKGTRGAKVLVDVEVDREIHGELHGPLTIRAWAGADVVEIGRRYIVAVDGRGPTPSNYILFGSVEIPVGEEEAAVAAHQQLIATLKTRIERDKHLQEQ
jgi:hypothetical protein